MAYRLSDKNFQNLKTEFKRETGLDASIDIKTYITYYQAKMLDRQTQVLEFILEEISKEK